MRTNHWQHTYQVAFSSRPGLWAITLGKGRRGFLTRKQKRDLPRLESAHLDLLAPFNRRTRFPRCTHSILSRSTQGLKNSTCQVYSILNVQCHHPGGHHHRSWISVLPPLVNTSFSWSASDHFRYVPRHPRTYSSLHL